MKLLEFISLRFNIIINENENKIPDFILVDGIEKSTKNSENKYISNNIESILNFYKWFGNSVFVDEKNRPLVCYHITNNNFNVFKPSKIGKMGSGIYFSSFKDDVIIHGKRYNANIILSVYLTGENTSQITNPFSKKELSNNYDSIWASRGEKGAEEILVMNSNQIKSVDNDGSWDTNDDNIYS